MGVGDALTDVKLLDAAANELGQIAGQRPSIRRSKKSIANFKLREGQPIGCMVTLRGARMYEFYDRLINVAVPRIRDFRGLNARSFDGRGNYTMGLPEVQGACVHALPSLWAAARIPARLRSLPHLLPRAGAVRADSRRRQSKLVGDQAAAGSRTTRSVLNAGTRRLECR
jgi:hypothetical protein